MSRWAWLILAWAMAASAIAQTLPPPRDPARQLAAELLILAGDIDRLRHEKMGPLETAGLEQRVHGALASLPLALRRAGDSPAAVPLLRRLAAQRDWPALRQHVDVLLVRHPFAAGSLLAATASAEAAALGATLHRTACAGCHAAPGSLDQLLPAKNLPAQMRAMSPAEFAARLWLGVRGDATTALQNPFSNDELAALISHYRQSR